MGYPVMFYVDNDNKENLANVENRSFLVNNLLRKHFLENKPTIDVLKQKLSNIEELKQKIEIEEAEANKIIIEKKQAEFEEIEKEKELKEIEERGIIEKRQLEENIEKDKNILSLLLGFMPTGNMVFEYRSLIRNGKEEEISKYIEKWKKQNEQP